MPTPDFQKLLFHISQIAKNAAQLLAENRFESKKVEQDLRRDVKVKADSQLEAFILKDLSQNFDYPILSEEVGQIEGAHPESQYHWIVDPLDGSLNFSKDIPFCCISIALWQNMEPKLGVVYDFNRDALFTGLVGKGAWLNGVPIQSSAVLEKSQAILLTGFPVSTDFSHDALSGFIAQLQRYKKVRLLGSAALSLAYVACGRADCYQENDVKIWDIAAGLALVKAAGGNINFLPSATPNTLTVKASNAHIFQN